MTEYLDYVLDSIVNLAIALFDDIIEMFTDIIFWFWEQVLDMVGWVVAKVDTALPDIDMAGYWAMVGGDIIQVLNYIDFGECITIIIAAITLRFFLNFVPFIR